MAHKCKSLSILLVIYLLFWVAGCEENPSFQNNSKIKIKFPNGGELLYSDSTYSILWESNGVEKVNIAFSTDHGFTWQKIQDEIPALLGEYNWKTPNTNIVETKIKIESKDNIMDVSDDYFAITQDKSLKLLFPNGGEILIADSLYLIQWVSKGIEKVDLEFSSDGGNSWEIIHSEIPATPSEYFWRTPNKDIAEVKIKIESNDNISDISDNFFSILQNKSIQLLYPKRGETLIADSIYSILWESKNIDEISIYFSDNCTYNWSLVAEHLDSEFGKFDWKAPDLITRTGFIKIESIKYSISIETDSTFNIFYNQEIIQDAIKYYPLQIGDFWIYNVNDQKLGGDLYQYMLKKEVFDKILSNNTVYYLIKEKPIVSDSSQLDLISLTNRVKQVRVDENDGYIKEYSTTNKIDIFKLNISQKNNTVITEGTGQFQKEYTVEKESDEIFHGINTKIKVYKFTDLYSTQIFEFVKGIGQTRFALADDIVRLSLDFKGAKIGGSVIGDTLTLN